jgi:tRNA uridine 5-carbamoylmethylation protein Kti12
MNTSQKLIIIRGIPGSGKTTKALELKKTIPECFHFEADSYFMKNGVYKFDPSKLGPAHCLCQSLTKNCLREGYSVIVSNTGITKKEVQPYLNMAKELNIPVEIIIMRGEFQNVHGVPEEKLQSMRERFEEF